MAKSRASKGLLVPPNTSPVPNATAREQWLNGVVSGFTASPANRKYYEWILRALWPEGHGIPGPHVSQDDLHRVFAEESAKEGNLKLYRDVFRRMRELQGEEGVTGIMKEGKKYQLQNLTLGLKRPKRTKPKNSLWAKLKANADYRCAHCGLQEPTISLSPDHRVPRSRNGSADDWNWQPLCEQCNNAKSSACQRCELNCSTCHWAYPETYKLIVIDDANRELIRRAAEEQKVYQTDIANRILREYFNPKK
jgi:hypothetical protein